MGLEYVKKRDGTTVEFDSEKIRKAVMKAASAVELENEAIGEEITQEVISYLKIFFGDEIYTEKFNYKFRDTSILAQALIDAKKLPKNFSTKLVDMVNYFNLDKGYKNPHDAQEDCKFTILIYKELLNLI